MYILYVGGLETNLFLFFTEKIRTSVEKKKTQNTTSGGICRNVASLGIWQPSDNILSFESIVYLTNFMSHKYLPA